MWDYINSLIERAVGPVRRLADEVRDRILALYSTLTTVMGNLGHKFGALANMVSWWRWVIRRQATEIFNTFRYVFLIAIPRAIATGVDEVRRWVSSTVDSVRREARALLDALGRVLTAAINRALSWLDSLQRWAQSQVSAITSWLSWFRNTILPRLTDPAKMAEWSAGAMLGPLMRYVDAHAEAWTERLLGMAVRTVMRLLPRVERFITRVF